MKVIFKPNKLVAVVFYFFFFLLGASLINLMVIMGLCNSSGLAYSEVSKYVSDTSLTRPENIDMLLVNASAISNLIVYPIAILVICFYMRDELKNDFLAIKENPKKLLLIIIGGFIFLGLAYCANLINNLLPTTSNNQSSLTRIFRETNYAVPVAIFLVVGAPLIEELIFRKCIFYYMRNLPIWMPYAASSLIFTLLHTLSTTSLGFGWWLLMCVPYLICALLLCALYHITGKNVYGSYFGHLLNNILALILVFI